jgi:penicillin V acylase-like amidase (Ntn superfamily)
MGFEAIIINKVGDSFVITKKGFAAIIGGVMQRYALLLITIIIMTCVPVTDSHACTAFCTKQDLFFKRHWLVGVNYDWLLEDGLVMINKRGLSKTTQYDSSVSEMPAKWTSKYGSVTFNQYGRECGARGMNEAGLVVSSLIDFGAVQYPTPDSRPAVSHGQWVQYLLDNYATVREIVESDNDIRIGATSDTLPSHYFVCDKKGECLVIEFRGGNPVYYTGDNLPIKLLTNTPYADALNFLDQDTVPVPDPALSVWRFLTAAKSLHGRAVGSGVKFAFDILKKVSTYLDNDWTEWSIVFDLTTSRVYFITLSNTKVRYFDLKDFDLSCTRPTKILSMQADLEGDVTDDFIDYTKQANRDLIDSAFGKTALVIPSFALPDTTLDWLSFYPEHFVCCPCR